MNSLKVTAQLAYTRDVGRSIARIDPKSIKALGVSEGEYLELRGRSVTAVKCLPLYPSDRKQGIARLDGLIRQNAGASVGEQLNVKKATVSSARRMYLIPLGQRIGEAKEFVDQWQHGDNSMESTMEVESTFAAEALTGVPVVNGDIVVINYHESAVPTHFVVLGKEPEEGISVVSMTTKMELIPPIIA